MSVRTSMAKLMFWVAAAAALLPILRADKGRTDRLLDQADAVVVGELLSGQQSAGNRLLEPHIDSFPQAERLVRPAAESGLDSGDRTHRRRGRLACQLPHLKAAPARGAPQRVTSAERPPATG